MTELLVALPVAVPLVTAAVCVVAWNAPQVQRIAALAGLGALLAIAVSLVVSVVQDGSLGLAIGGWSAPVGIRFHADLLAALMVLIAAVIGATVAVYAVGDTFPEDRHRGFWPLLVLLVMGVNGAFLTADLFNLFVWFEVMLIASFVLLGLGTERAELKGAHVYVVLSLIGSILLLIAIGILYAAVRTLDFALISDRVTELSASQPGLVIAIQALLLVSFGIKAAVFPLMFWLPASYHTPSPPVSALFAALLTKVGVYAMIRVTAGVFPPSGEIQLALVIIAIATMAVGVLGALAQTHLRRILSFHIVSQIGYMVAGLALAQGSPEARRFAIAAAIFYVIHHILVKANLFLIAGIIRVGRGTESLDRLGGVARLHPFLAALFLISALSLAGVPPLSGFWAKLAIISAGIERGRVVLVVTAVAVGLLTLTSMLKIWSCVFAGDSPDRERPLPGRRDRLVVYAAATTLAALTIVLSIAPDVLFQLALRAADHVRPLELPVISSGGTP